MQLRTIYYYPSENESSEIYGVGSSFMYVQSSLYNHDSSGDTEKKYRIKENNCTIVSSPRTYMLGSSMQTLEVILIKAYKNAYVSPQC